MFEGFEQFIAGFIAAIENIVKMIQGFIKSITEND